MNTRHTLAALTVTISLFGCTTSSNPGVYVNLAATRQNAGQIGNVTLSDWGKQTGLSFFVSGAPIGSSLPLRLYSFINQGSCQSPGPVAFALNDRVTTERQPIRGWTFSRSAPVALPELLSSEHHILVRTAATDGNVDIFCGDIKQKATSI
jgi:hypothetical protein